MSERTVASLNTLDKLLASLGAMPRDAAVDGLVENAEALRRAVAAFHMEAIRFRMFNVDRSLEAAPQMLRQARLDPQVPDQLRKLAGTL